MQFTVNLQVTELASRQVVQHDFPVTWVGESLPQVTQEVGVALDKYLDENLGGRELFKTCLEILPPQN